MYIMQNNNLSGTTENIKKSCIVFFGGSDPKVSVTGFLEDNNTCTVFVGTPVAQYDSLLTKSYQPNNSYSLMGENGPIGTEFDCTAPKIFQPGPGIEANPQGFGPVGDDGKITNEFSCVRK